MDSVFATGLGPILVLWIGALVLYVLDQLFEPQDHGTAEIVVLFLALGFLFNARAQVGVPVPLGQSLADLNWPGLAPYLVVERDSWLLSLLVLGLATAISFTSLGKPNRGRRLSLAAPARLALLGAVLLYLAAGDWVTLAAAWGLVDLALLYIANLRPAGPDSARQHRLGWTLVLSLLGPILVVTALALWQASGATAWVNRTGTLPIAGLYPRRPIARAATLLAIAGLLRLMPPPLPSWQSATVNTAEQDGEGETHPGSALLVTLVPALLGAYYWARLAGWGALTEARWTNWLPLWGGLLLLIAAVRAWSANDPESLVARLQTYASATMLLIAGSSASAPVNTAWPMLVGASAVLGTSTLYAAWRQGQYLDPFDTTTYWRVAPMAVAILSLAGLPFLAGFPTRVALYWAIFTAKHWLALLAMIAGEALYLSAALRLLFELEAVPDPESVAVDDLPSPQRAEGLEEGMDGLPSPRWGELEGGVERDVPPLSPDGTWWQRVATWARGIAWQNAARYGGAATLALATVALGLMPRPLCGDGLGTWWRLPTLPMWAALLLPVIGAVVLYRAQDQILRAVGAWWPWVERHLSLDAFYRGAGRLLQSLGTLVWNGTLLIEGAGYMAWVVLVCLLILLFVISR
jgi:formate hydrogenlyase subunit 3/multisubunit Na+/H+ antiporter MnhD subunit